VTVDVNLALSVHIGVLAVYFCTVWFCTKPGADAKSNKEILQMIRLECDDMTRRAPFASFHVAAGTISLIGVSISMSATASGDAIDGNKQ
jgi:hypothetical protein